MEQVKLRELHTAARVADALVWAAGGAGVLAGGLLLRAGEPGFAAVAWALTFVAGAGLRLAAWLARGVAELLDRTRRMETDVAALERDTPPAPRRAAGEPGAPPDPYERWGGFH